MAETRNTIRWDSVGADKVKRDYADVRTANDGAASGFKATGAAATQAGGGITNLSNSTKGYAAHAEIAAKSSNLFSVGLASIARSVGVGALLAGAAVGIKAAVSALDDLGDQAQRVGLTAVALQELQNAARRSDADVATLNSSWEKFTKATGEATQGSGKLNDILKQYNIALRNSDGTTRSTMALYLELADAAKKTGDSTEIARIAISMFGKEGIGLASMVSKGADGFREMSKEAHEAGRIVSEDLVQAAGEMQHKYDEVLDTLTAKWRTFAVVVAQSLNLVDKTERQQAQRSIDILQPQLKALNDRIARGPDASDQSGLDQLRGTATAKAEAEYQKLLVRRTDLVRTLLDLKTKLVQLDTAPVDPGFVAPESEGDASKRDAEATKAAAAREKAQREAATALADRLRFEGEEFAQMNKMTDAMMKGVDATNDATDARNAYQASLDDELRLLGMSDRARAIEIERLNAETEAVGILGEARAAERAKFVADAMAKRGAIYDQQQTIDAAKKAAEEVDAIWEQAKSGISDSWSDLWFDIFDKGKFKFGDFAKSLKSIWARTIADMIALSTQQSIVQPLFNAMFGGMQGGGTGAAGTRDALSWLTGGGSGKGVNGDSMGSLADLGDGSGLKVSNGAPTEFQSQLGNAMRGAAIGGMVGGGKTGAALGAVGGMIGSALGPIGSMVGSVIGGLIGGLMKSTPKSISSYGTSGVTDSMAAGGLDVKIGKDMASGVLRALRTFSEQLLTGIENDEFLGIVGQRGKKFFFQSQQSDIKSAGKGKYGAVKFDSAEEAIAAAIEAAINSGVVKGLTDADKKLMRAAGSVEQAMQDVIASHDFKRELDFQFTGLSNPLSEAQARLEFEYQQQLILADKYEADKTKLEAVYAQKRLDLVKQYNDQQNAAMEQSLGGLKAYLFDLTGGSASPLSPTNRLNLAQSNYNSIKSRALAGDKDAIGQLQGASQDFLSASRSVFGSASGFQTNYQNVVATLSQITGSANPLGAANNNAAAAVNDNTRVQSAYAERAATQRADTNAKLDTVISLLAASANRGSMAPTQNGVVTVGTVDWASITQAVASIR